MLQFLTENYPFLSSLFKLHFSITGIWLVNLTPAISEYLWRIAVASPPFRRQRWLPAHVFKSHQSELINPCHSCPVVLMYFVWLMWSIFNIASLVNTSPIVMINGCSAITEIRDVAVNGRVVLFIWSHDWIEVDLSVMYKSRDLHNVCDLFYFTVSCTVITVQSRCKQEIDYWNVT